jgi:molybdopterin-guanine dinucleotide biosynthesis protein A
MSKHPRTALTGVILAGGRARRMGGRDKGLLELCGEPLARRAARLLAPQVGRLIVNANRNRQRYVELLVEFPDARVIGDDLDGFLGPLAGMLAALEATDTDYVLTMPCDSPLLRADYAERMHAALKAAGAELTVARDGERLQPVFALLHRALAADLRAALAAGERKIDRWYARQRMTTADFSDAPELFRNVNTPGELAALETELNG